MYLVPAAELVVDNPHADGMLSKHGFAYDWRFESVKDDRPSQAEDFRPTWIGDGCEIIPVLRALGLRGYAVKADMDLSEWSVEAGDYWKAVRPAGKPRVAYLFWYDARPDRHGIVMSMAEFEPRVAVWMWRFSPPDGQTEPVFVEVTLHGDGLGPAYTVQVPLHDQTYKYPRLWRHDVGDAEPHIVDELQRYDAARLAMAGGAVEQHLWVEETDGVLVISLSGAAEPWVYQPEDGQGPSRGHISVTFRGHCAMFNLQPIQYPSQGTATPTHFLYVPDWINRTPQYLAVTGGVGTVSVAEDTQSDATSSRPVVTLTRTEACKRPVVYVVHQYHEAAIDAGEAFPSSTVGDENLLALRWRRRLYRGWEFRATLRDFDGGYEWKGNEKVTVKVGWQSADVQVMVGYLREPARLREADEYLGRAVVEVQGADYVTARLSRRKYMTWHGSPVGWNFASWFRYVLNRAGVADALVAVEDDGYIIQAMPDRWRGRYEFGHDVQVVDALDEVVRSRGWVWGVNEQGEIWAGPEPEYSGVPDFVLDDAATAEDERIRRVEAQRASEQFRNYVAVFAGRDKAEAAIWRDEDSHRDPSSPSFIGDDWWLVEVAPDERDPAVAAWQMFQQAYRQRHEIVWETIGRPQLAPGMFVRVDVDGLGVPAGTVFQITEDMGMVDRQRGVFRSIFLARVIEE